jgi:chromosome segregation ATPase
MTKLEKIEREMQKTKEKITQLQTRLKELDREFAEQEDLQIVEAIRALKLTREELRDFIGKGALPQDRPGAVSSARYAKKKPVRATAVSDTEGTNVTDDPTTESEGATNED